MAVKLEVDEGGFWLTSFKLKESASGQSSTGFKKCVTFMSIGKERAAEEVNILVLLITVNTLPGQKTKVTTWI